jgi:hypothetical protein
MNDISRHQNVTGQLNRQAADRITANASVFLSSPRTFFFKILAKLTNSAFVFA